MRNVAGRIAPGWLRPAAGEAAPAVPLRFPWKETYARLRDLADSGACSTTDGLVLEYINPATGGPVFPTMSCTVQLLRPGQRTQPRRRTSSAVFFVISGAGRTQAGSADMRWGRHDSFVVPNWTWHSHENLSRTEDVILFSVSDAPAILALGMYREELDNADTQ